MLSSDIIFSVSAFISLSLIPLPHPLTLISSGLSLISGRLLPCGGKDSLQKFQASIVVMVHNYGREDYS